MKSIHHIAIICVLIVLTLFLYGEGLGAIPFLLTAFYLGCLSLKEFKRLKNSKR